MVLAFHAVTLRFTHTSVFAKCHFESVWQEAALDSTLSGCWLMASILRRASLFVCFLDVGQTGIDTWIQDTVEEKKNSTKHFNPKLACHGFHELQTDNKSVVLSGLKRCPSVMWRDDKRASFSFSPSPASLQVESPLAVDAVLGESPFSVTDDKVSITEMRVHAISGLTLSLQPSPGNSHTMVAKATGLQTLTTPKQVR